MNAWLEVVGIAAAFVVGYLVGRISAAVAQDRKPTREVAVDVREVSNRLDRFNRGPWLVTLAAFVLIAIGIQAGISAQQHSQDASRIQALATCVAQYENRLSVALPPVRSASRQNDSADIEFKRAVLALFAPGAGHKEVAAVKRALAHNIDVYDHLGHVRQANPYPTPPKKVCPSE